MLRLLTNTELLKVYGDPNQFLDADGAVTSGWRASIIDTFALPVPIPLSWGGSANRISCHKLVRPELERIFHKLLKSNIWPKDYGGCYQFRTIANKTALSRHSWGLAVDLNVKDNPRGSRGSQPGEIVEAFYEEGWKWGGFFSDPDPMHFEKGISIVPSP